MDTHQNTAFFDALLVFFHPLFWHVPANESTNQSTASCARTRARNGCCNGASDNKSQSWKSKGRAHRSHRSCNCTHRPTNGAANACPFSSFVAQFGFHCRATKMTNTCVI